MNVTTNAPNGRGCGLRQKSAGYLACGLGDDGLPIELFLVDPVIPYPGEWVRGMKLMPRVGGDDDVNDVLIFVGRSFYKSPWAFFLETSLFGASRRFTPDFPFDQLTPGKSRMLFVHRLADPKFYYNLDSYTSATDACQVQHGLGELNVQGWHVDGTPCVFAHSDLAYYIEKVEDLGLTPDGRAYFKVNYPSFDWTGMTPGLPLLQNGPTLDDWGAAIFFALPLTHVEFCESENVDSANNACAAGYEVATLEY